MNEKKLDKSTQPVSSSPSYHYDPLSLPHDMRPKVPPGYNTISYPLSPSRFPEVTPTPSISLSKSVLQYETEISKLRNEIIILRENSQTKSADLENKILELTAKLELGYLLSQVNEEAQQLLLSSDEFKLKFQTKQNHPAFVISIDIRRSTDLMLNARSSEDFEIFISDLCNQFTKVILDNFGVFDKFTGDGIIAFFPEFFSGEDAGLLALKSAKECHEIFNSHYLQYRSIFKVVLKEVGLGIGIDYGNAYIVCYNHAYTAIGEPVVYACRMSGTPFGTVALNQPAFGEISKKYNEFYLFEESSIEVKHIGVLLTYLVTQKNIDIKISKPKWIPLKNETKETSIS